MLNSLHLFAGAGGGILADKLLGHRPIGAVEIEAYPRKVLLARQLDGSLPRFPIWDDITTFRADNPDTGAYIERLRGIRNNLVVCGGFPCQDISAAGRGAGITGERSGLWKEMARVIREIRPRFVFVENSPMLTSRGLGVVLGDLAEMGFDAEWGVLGANDAGAPHQRDRIWILGDAYNNGHATAKVGESLTTRNDRNAAGQVKASEFTRSSQQYAQVAYANIQRPAVGTSEQLRGTLHDFNGNGTPQECRRHDEQLGVGCSCKGMAYTNSTQREGRRLSSGTHQEHADIGSGGWWKVEPNVGRVVDGLEFRVDRLKAIGNGQVPQCAALAWRILSSRLGA